MTCFRQALELKPNYAEAYSNLGNALQAQGILDEAIAAYRRALDVNHDYAEAHSNLGTAVQDQGNLDEAIVSYRRALDLKRDYAEAHLNLGAALQAQGKLDDAVASYHRALEVKPGFGEAYSNLLFTLQYRAGSTLSELAAAHAEYERRYAAPLRGSCRPHENARDPERGCDWGSCLPISVSTRLGFFWASAGEIRPWAFRNGLLL